MNIDMLFFFASFLVHVLLFLDDNVDEEYESFQIAKVHPQSVAQLLLIFLPISV